MKTEETRPKGSQPEAGEESPGQCCELSDGMSKLSVTSSLKDIPPAVQLLHYGISIASLAVFGQK